MKIVVSNPETGKTYQKEVEENKARALYNKRIGQEVSGSLIDIDGYTLQVTGGSDKQGFPMRRGLSTTERKKLLLKGGTGYRPKERGTKKRKTVRGEIVDKDIEQLNLKVTKKGKKGLAVIFGAKEEAEEETKEEKDEEQEPMEEETEEEPQEKQEEDKEEQEKETEEKTEETKDEESEKETKEDKEPEQEEEPAEEPEENEEDEDE